MNQIKGNYAILSHAQQENSGSCCRQTWTYCNNKKEKEEDPIRIYYIFRKRQREYIKKTTYKPEYGLQHHGQWFNESSMYMHF